MRRTSWILAFALAASLSASGCGEDGPGAATDAGGVLRVYSSLPLQGDARPQSQDVVRGIELALKQADGRAGEFRIKYISLDGATASAGKWDPGQTSANARKAISDDAAIAYIGEFNSGASAISIPILNEGGLLQVSPANTYVGLTRAEGAEADEPDKYYPSGQRTYGRVVPADHIQAAAIATYMQDVGCKKAYLMNDKEVYGQGIAGGVQKAAEALGLDVVANDGIDIKAANYRSLAAKVRGSGADCHFFGGLPETRGVQVFKDVHAAVPGIKGFGPDGLATSTFATKLGPDIEKRTYLTNPTLDPKLYPPAAREFVAAFKRTYDKEPEPYAIYGYEAMSVVLDAIRRAGDRGDDRGAVVEAFFRTRGRDSVLGRYDVDANGDTTLTDYGGNRIRGGQLVFDKVIKASID